MNKNNNLQLLIRDYKNNNKSLIADNFWENKERFLGFTITKEHSSYEKHINYLRLCAIANNPFLVHKACKKLALEIERDVKANALISIERISLEIDKRENDFSKEKDALLTVVNNKGKEINDLSNSLHLLKKELEKLNKIKELSINFRRKLIESKERVDFHILKEDFKAKIKEINSWEEKYNELNTLNNNLMVNTEELQEKYDNLIERYNEGVELVVSMQAGKALLEHEIKALSDKLAYSQRNLEQLQQGWIKENNEKEEYYQKYQDELTNLDISKRNTRELELKVKKLQTEVNDKNRPLLGFNLSWKKPFIFGIIFGCFGIYLLQKIINAFSRQKCNDK